MRGTPWGEVGLEGCRILNEEDRDKATLKRIITMRTPPLPPSADIGVVLGINVLSDLPIEVR